MKPATFIKVSGGQLFVSDMVKPESPHTTNFTLYDKYVPNDRLFNESFVRVGNPGGNIELALQAIADTIQKKGSGFQRIENGLYPVDGALQFEVKQILSNGADHDGQQCEYTMCYFGDHKIKDKCLGWCEKVAIVSLKPTVEEKPVVEIGSLWDYDRSLCHSEFTKNLEVVSNDGKVIGFRQKMAYTGYGIEYFDGKTFKRANPTEPTVEEFDVPDRTDKGTKGND